MENQRKPTAPGTPHRSSVEQLQGLWHTLARWHSTKPLMKCWWECWNAGCQGLSFGKANFNIWFLHHTLIASQQELSGKLLLHTHPPRPQLYNGTLTTRHAQMGPGKHTEPMNAADISTCCSTLSFRHLANTSALQCIGLYLATQTLRLGVKFQPKKVWFLAWFFWEPKFPDSWSSTIPPFVAPLEFQGANS